MVKPKVYIETSVISYLTARPSNDLRAAASQQATTEWWEARQGQFDLFVSELVIAEASLGHAEAATRRLAAIADIPELAATDDARALGMALIADGALPKQAEIDAYHIAIAAVNGIEYLLTWNCTHIANARMRPKIEAVCRARGFEPPIICTPLELMED
jgi:predicted nucleic acid-binding protein